MGMLPNTLPLCLSLYPFSVFPDPWIAVDRPFNDEPATLAPDSIAVDPLSIVYKPIGLTAPSGMLDLDG
jgi:hypothetical protein